MSPPARFPNETPNEAAFQQKLCDLRTFMRVDEQTARYFWNCGVWFGEVTTEERLKKEHADVLNA